MFAPPPVAAIAGDYVVKHIWPKVHEEHSEVTGFALVDLPSNQEVFLWKEDRDPGENLNGGPVEKFREGRDHALWILEFLWPRQGKSR